MCSKKALSSRGFHIYKYGSSPKELILKEDSRIPGGQDSSDMLRNYKELNPWKTNTWILESSTPGTLSPN
jgi:hypothetical protein